MSLPSNHHNQIAEIKRRLAELDRDRQQLVTELALLSESGPAAAPANQPPAARHSADAEPVAAKLAVFRRLFRGRDDVYAMRWQDPKTGRSGYKPACRYNYGKINPADGKPERVLLPFNDEVVMNHVRGTDSSRKAQAGFSFEFVVGVYPLLPDETCWFLAADFDKKTWAQDAMAYAQTCRSYDIQAAVERSRSGNGAHVWIFFQEPLAASLARKLGAFFLTKTMERRPEIGLDSYDRFFPNQDTMPAGNFGNLIALPLQRRARDDHNSVFVDDAFLPHRDQMVYLAGLAPASRAQVSEIVERAERHDNVLGVRRAAIDDEFDAKPWTLPPSLRRPKARIAGELPLCVDVVLSNQLFIVKEGLPPQLVNEIIRLAAFQNPEFYKTQTMRFSTFGKPRIVACAEYFPLHIALARGCFDDLTGLFRGYGIGIALIDERVTASPVHAVFRGNLRASQEKAAAVLLKSDFGVLAVPTGFGKTVIAARMIAERGQNTLILVHRKQLVDQWKEQLAQFLDVDAKRIGQIGGGKNRPTGVIDIAMTQSLYRKGVVDDVVANYGHVIVDECHHVSAYSFERVARACKAKYVLGLSATPARRDGHHPIIFMQCGPIRFHLDPRLQAAARSFEHRVVTRPTTFMLDANGEPPVIQQLYGLLARDAARNDLILKDVADAIAAGRSPLILTERAEHVDLLVQRVTAFCANVFTLRGGMSARHRQTIAEGIKQAPADMPRVLIGTGRYVGEGFDDARLDTLFLALPISWRGALTQYAGRLHRDYDGKKEVVIYDYVDESVPMLARMYSKRLAGYRAIGYRV